MDNYLMDRDTDIITEINFAHVLTLALLAQVYGCCNQWDESLNAAHQGLALDPAHIDCCHQATTALLSLSREQDALAMVERSLQLDPSDSKSHTLLGCTFLSFLHNTYQTPDSSEMMQKAIQQFETALRLNPMLTSAQQGLEEMLKLRCYWPHRWNTRYPLPYTVALILITVVLGVLMATSGPLGLLLMASWFVMMLPLTFLSEPTATVWLQFDPLGRLVLTPIHYWASRWFIAVFLTTLVMLNIGIYTDIIGTTLFSLVGIGVMATVFRIAKAPERSQPMMQRLMILMIGLGIAMSIAFGLYELVDKGNAYLTTISHPIFSGFTAPNPVTALRYLQTSFVLMLLWVGSIFLCLSWPTLHLLSLPRLRDGARFRHRIATQSKNFYTDLLTLSTVVLSLVWMMRLRHFLYWGPAIALAWLTAISICWLMASWFNWPWFYTHPLNRPLVQKVGLQTARYIYGISGGVGAIVCAWIFLTADASHVW